MKNDQNGTLAWGLLIFSGGLCFILTGIWTWSDGGIVHFGVFAPVTKLTTVGIIVYGAYLMRVGYKAMKEDKPEVKYLKCTGCGHVCFAHEAHDRKCPKCSGAVENLDGFFDRHPEFRDKGLEKK
jgi:ribosomal protein S27E